MDGQTIPKSAFSAQSEITEFRALAAAKLNRDLPLMSPHLEFVCQREDFRNARMLHILKAGGWRLWLKRFLLGAWGVWVLAYFCAKVPGEYIAAVAVLALVLLAFYLSKAASLRRKHYLGPLQIYFNEEGLFLQDPATVSRTPWTQFVGYVEGDRVLLLYYNARRYRVIPRRALTGHGAEFVEMVKAKLPLYDYRRAQRKS
jgi:hypothetical protein